MQGIIRKAKTKSEMDNEPIPDDSLIFGEDADKFNGYLEFATRFNKIWLIMNERVEGVNAEQHQAKLIELKSFLVFFESWKISSIEKTQARIVCEFDAVETLRISTSNDPQNPNRQTHSGKFSDIRSHSNFFTVETTKDIVRILTSFIHLIEYWTSKGNIESLQTNEKRGHFATATSEAANVTDADIDIKSIFQFDEINSLQDVYILIGKFFTDVCEHAFGEVHTLTGINKQTAKAISASAHTFLCKNVQEG